MSVVVAAAPAGVTEAGLKAQVIPVGATHEKLTGLEKPLAGVTVSVKLIELPAATVPDCDEEASEKAAVP